MNDIYTISRQLKIDLITDEPNDLIKWFNNIWDILIVVETNVFHNDGGEFIYYITADNLTDVIFYRDDVTQLILVNYSKFTQRIMKYFHFTDNLEDLYSVLQLLLDSKINIDNPITYSFGELNHAKVPYTLQQYIKNNNKMSFGGCRQIIKNNKIK